jgi:exopolysaccharide biosynthesis polyprenyl glycosylphosphotransferase
MAGDQTVVLDRDALYEELASSLDEHSIATLERRPHGLKRRGWLVRRMLMGADLTGLIVAFITSVLVLTPPGAAGHADERIEWISFFASLPLWVFAAKLYGLYDRDEERTDHPTVDDLVDVFHMVTVGTWLFLVVTWVTHLAHPDVMKLALFWAIAVPCVTLGRVFARIYCRRRVVYLQNAVIVGAGDVGQLIGRKLLQHPEYGINLVGFVDAEPKERRGDLQHLTLLGGPEKLPEIVKAFDVERVLIAFSRDSHEGLLDLIRSLKNQNVQIDIVPRLFDIVGTGVEIHTVEGVPLLGLKPLRLSRSSRFMKRLLDVILSTFGLIALAPLFAIVAVAIKLDSRGPVFFRQVRMGTGDRTFRIYKFRTMAIDAEERKQEVAHLNKYLEGEDARLFKIPSDPRSTRVGRVLRKYSIDELPQLINVLKGEMSMVGPRPLILSEDQHVTAWARNRLTLRPGMTGLWQVLGRNEIPFHEMTKLDYLYVTNWSLRGDIGLILRTIPAVLRGRAAY